jgi:hypothetical protein
MIESGHTKAALQAAGALAQLLDEQGDTDGAEVEYRRVVDSQDTDLAPRSMVNLAGLLKRQGQCSSRALYQASCWF